MLCSQLQVLNIIHNKVFYLADTHVLFARYCIRSKIYIVISTLIRVISQTNLGVKLFTQSNFKMLDVMLQRKQKTISVNG